MSIICRKTSAGLLLAIQSWSLTSLQQRLFKTGSPSAAPVGRWRQY